MMRDLSSLAPKPVTWQTWVRCVGIFGSAAALYAIFHSETFPRPINVAGGGIALGIMIATITIPLSKRRRQQRLLQRQRSFNGRYAPPPDEDAAQ